MNPPPDPAVRPAPRNGGTGLLAARPFPAGATILVAEGAVLPAPTRTSLQIGLGAHLDVPPGSVDPAHLWRYLDHACEPNAAFRGRALVALRDVEVGEALTFDYETTEWSLASPFDCACGSMGCRGRRIRGFAHLSREERMRRWPQLRDDLRASCTSSSTTP